ASRPVTRYDEPTDQRGRHDRRTARFKPNRGRIGSTDSGNHEGSGRGHMRTLSISTRERIAEQLGQILADGEVKREILGRLGPSRGGVSKGMSFEPGAAAAKDAIANFDASKPVQRFGEPEAIVIKIGRPVLFIQNNSFHVGWVPTDAESRIWGARLN